MKKTILALCAMTLFAGAAHAEWKPAGDKIKTEWAEKVDPSNVLPEYPRPQLVRSAWSNLNGLWEYAIRPMGESEPAAFDGQILVPFAVESSLSGVQKSLDETQELWYKRTFDVPSAWKNKEVILHFGAVDWKADVFVNDVLVGSHKGGFTPFSFNVTPYLTGSKNQKLVVRVYDSTSKGYQPRGKQVFDPKGIWYTPVSGIWQTVWLEPVAPAHITAVVPTADIDKKTLAIDVKTAGAQFGDVLDVKLFDGKTLVAEAKQAVDVPIVLNVKEPKLWDVENPFLYDLKVTLLRDGKTVDAVDSYAAMRKISVMKDKKGIKRMALNNKILFQYGPLDQGWWPDGLYTAPTDEALLYDIVKTKEWGFNMIRKHVKVEPARWYYHCDKEGILVWQDMPSGDNGNQWDSRSFNGGTDRNRTQESKDNWYHEWGEIIDLCRPYACVVVLVPFNEAWGQFDTEEAVAWTREQDPTRLINSASGGNHRFCGDILDLHHYPGPNMFLYDPSRVNVLGEYGGIGLPLQEHLWNPDMRNWGYIQFKDKQAVTDEYVKYAKMLEEQAKQGFSAAVYTQTTDVEGEVNGLMTYDRKVIKVVEPEIRAANEAVIRSID